MPRNARTLALALAAGKMGAWELDTREFQMSCSPDCKRIFGVLPSSDFAYTQFVASIHADDLSRLKATLAESSQAGSEFELEFRIHWPDRSQHWILMRGAKAESDLNDAVLVGVVLEVSDRKRGEESVRLSEERYRALIHATAQIVWVTDAEGHGMNAQSSWESFTGTDGSGFQWLESIHPDDRAGTERAWLQAIRSGTIYEIEHRIRQSDGEYRLMHARGIPVRDANGHIREWIGTHSEITEQRAFEDALRDAQAKLSLAMHVSGIGMFDWDIAGNRLSWSPEIYELYGISPLEFRGRYEDWLNSVHPDDRVMADTHIAEALRTGKYGLDFRVIRPVDGQVRWFTSRGEVSYDLLHNPSRLLGINMDITEQREAEEALKESDERFRRTFENAAVGMAHVGLDGKWIRVNQRLCEITGYSKEELLRTDFQSITHPGDLKEDLTLVRKLLAGEVEQFRMEKRYIRRDGSLVWATLSVSLMRDSDGAPDYFVSVVTDITARKFAEAALERSRRELEVAQRVGNFGSWSWNVESDVVEWSRELFRIFDRDPALPPPRFFEQESFFSPVSWIRLKRLVEESLETGQGYETDLQLVRLDGSECWAAVRAHAEFDRYGKVKMLYGTVLDITERKRGERQLREAHDELERKVNERTLELDAANRSLRELSGRLLQLQDVERRKLARDLHDSVGQLVAAIGMNIGAISGNMTNSNPRLQQLFRDSQELVQDLSKQIRTMSHLLHPPLLDEIGLLSALRWYTEEFTKRSGIKTTLQIPEDLERLPEDLEITIFRIVQEGLTNAHRHSGGSTIAVHVTREDSNLLVEIADDGKGFSAERLHDFNSGKSSGLGLRGMRERLRQLGGSLEIASSVAGTLLKSRMPFQTASREDVSLET